MHFNDTISKFISLIYCGVKIVMPVLFFLGGVVVVFVFLFFLFLFSSFLFFPRLCSSLHLVMHFKGVLHPKLKITMFCVLSQNYQHLWQNIMHAP